MTNEDHACYHHLSTQMTLHPTQGPGSMETTQRTTFQALHSLAKSLGPLSSVWPSVLKTPRLRQQLHLHQPSQASTVNHDLRHWPRGKGRKESEYLSAFRKISSTLKSVGTPFLQIMGFLLSTNIIHIWTPSFLFEMEMAIPKTSPSNWLEFWHS